MSVDPGTTVGSYRILRQLGSGGMGEVYLAEDARLSRKIALKFLPPGFVGDAERMRRFMREAKAASALNHPNIITVYEVGETPTAFIATEFIDGQSLRQPSGRAPSRFRKRSILPCSSLARSRSHTTPASSIGTSSPIM
jgi:eukaryotic-like serine/threonine-protein kinase